MLTLYECEASWRASERIQRNLAEMLSADARGKLDAASAKMTLDQIERDASELVRFCNTTREKVR